MGTRFSPRLRARSGRDGFIVVAVLWILAALATLASIFSMYVINTAMAFAVHDERLQAEGLARAAIELSAYQVASSTPALLSRGSFAFRIGNATANAGFSAETAGFVLLSAPPWHRQRRVLRGDRTHRSQFGAEGIARWPLRFARRLARAGRLLRG